MGNTLTNKKTDFPPLREETQMFAMCKCFNCCNYTDISLFLFIIMFNCRDY